MSLNRSKDGEEEKDLVDELTLQQSSIKRLNTDKSFDKPVSTINDSHYYTTKMNGDVSESMHTAGLDES
jgi:hypothetical protein